MPTLAETDTQLKLQSNDNLLDNIKDSTSLRHIGYLEAHKTWDKYNSAINHRDSYCNPKPVQEITT